MKKITVVGSLSMDLIVQTGNVPSAGETVFGESFSMLPGGKGANQAVAIARLAPRSVEMIGAVGSDAFGEVIKANLSSNAVLFPNLGTVSQSTGIAQITLYDNDNRIIIVPGANNEVKNLQAEAWDRLAASTLVVLQNEIPQETNEAIIDFCYERAVPTLYNPAPARRVSQEALDKVTYLTPNEHELSYLLTDLTQHEALAQYPNKLIITLGAKGVLYHDGTQEVLVPAFKVNMTDTTGAGDTFNGALAVALVNGLELKEAVKFGNLAASISVQKFGAQGGMPTLKEIKENEKHEKKWNFEQ